MVLVDGGGEWGTYISDITRTWPVNGKFSEPQRDLYNAVLNVHRSCVSLCRESAGLSLDKLHGIAENGLKDQLQQLGFDVSGSVSRFDVKYLSTFVKLIRVCLEQAMGILFPHHLGHYIGLDVHDCSGYPRSQNLKAGQCITIEP
jgi:intermediate cleaving peptidase 55